MERKNCLSCQDLIRGRSDKKFCSDNCRSDYHYKLNRCNSEWIRNIDRILKRNRNILAGFSIKPRQKINKEVLLYAGFNFSYCTNIHTTKTGKVYKFVYDQGYIELEDDFFSLVIKKEFAF